LSRNGVSMSEIITPENQTGYFNNNDKAGYSNICLLCIRRFFCSHNRVGPSGEEEVVVMAKSEGFNARVLRSRDDRRESTEASSAQQSRSELALSSMDIAEEAKIKATRPKTRTINRNPTKEEIAKLPHITSVSDTNLVAKSPSPETYGKRHAGRIILPPLSTPHEGAEGDALKLMGPRHKSIFRRKSDYHKAGDNGSGEKVKTFSVPLPTISSSETIGASALESAGIRHQNILRRKGGVSYDLIVPSPSSTKLPPLKKYPKPSSTFLMQTPEPQGWGLQADRTGAKSPMYHCVPQKFRPRSRSDLDSKLEMAENRRRARLAAGQAMRKKREEAILRNKVEREDLMHGKARDLDAKMAKVADKRKEQLARRQDASRNRIARVRQQGQLGSQANREINRVETDDMTEAEVFKFLVTRDDRGHNEDVAWWEK